MPHHFTPQDADRFWARVEVTDTCWYWTGHTNWGGYGEVQIKGQRYKVHRLAYELTYGPIPDGLFVCHACDTPPCVRPDHLFLGTRDDNAADRVAKHRPKGIKAGLTALLQRIRPPRPKPTLEERFWSKVDKRGPCWLWTASTYANGYGAFGIGNQKHYAHRIAYELAYGEIAGGLSVLHRCDTRACVRPDHLFLGRDADNVADMIAKGRNSRGDSHSDRLRATLPRGEDHPGAVLTIEDVRAIRRRFDARESTVNELAAEYRYSKGSMWKICHRKIWKHIE
jgi:hypothetical protein